MKKYILTLLFLFLITNVYASDKIEVKLKSCVDGDTAKLIIGKKTETVRFLAIDTEESVSKKKENTYMGKVASNYTCDKLTTAKKIEIEYDPASTKKDKYNRVLAWVYTDGMLLQEDLVKNGYAKVTYLYGDYLYTEDLLVYEDFAKLKHTGIWQDDNYIEILYNLAQKILKLFT